MTTTLPVYRWDAERRVYVHLGWVPHSIPPADLRRDMQIRWMMPPRFGPPPVGGAITAVSETIEAIVGRVIEVQLAAGVAFAIEPVPGQEERFAEIPGWRARPVPQKKPASVDEDTDA
jgi:hypothetical protein